MSFINYEELKKEVIGTSIAKPMGELSGHNVGSVFEESVYNKIKTKFPNDTFRQYEYLNYLYTQNLDAIGYKAKHTLFNSPTVMFLLNRGKNATDKWSIENPFEEKQNDTADILVVRDNYFEIIDIKTRNLSKNAQAPNIISSYKLAQVCAIMLDNNEFESFTINYFEVDWMLEDDNLVCKDTHIVNLFKANPENLYINWAAAMQIQFHVSSLEQNFNGDMRDWAIRYLTHFTTQARIRANDMIDKFVIPFEKYIR